MGRGQARITEPEALAPFPLIPKHIPGIPTSANDDVAGSGMDIVVVDPTYHVDRGTNRRRHNT